MNCNTKCNTNGCSCLGVVISIILGIIVGALFAFNYIPSILTIIWIALGLSILVLGFSLIQALVGSVVKCMGLTKCLKINPICLLGGAIGTIISSIIALSIVLITSNIFAIIIIGLLAFFFALMISGIIGFINNISLNTKEYC